MNIVFLLSLILIDMTLVIFMFNFYGKSALLLIYILHIFMSQITINLSYDILGFNTIIGSCFYAVLFLTLDMANEHYGKDTANSFVNVGVLSLIIMLLLLYFVRFMISSNSDNYSKAFLNLTNNQFRIIIVDIFVSYFLFQKLNVLIFDKIKKITGGKLLWLRNNASTIISQIFTAIMFYELSFCGTIEQYKIWQIILTGLIIKIIVSLFETPFLYISKKVGVKNEI